MQWIAEQRIATSMAQHESIRALWELKWKQLCATNTYPFHYATLEDMDPIIDDLERKDIKDPYGDAYPEVFLPQIQRLEKAAIEAENEGRFKEAENLYLRGSSVCMMARFPVINTPLKRNIFNTAKRLHLKGTSYWEAPIQNLIIPNIHASGKDLSHLQFYVRRPVHLTPSSLPTPVFVTLTGLDAYRTDSRPFVMHRAIELGYTCLLMEIPGTGDAAGDPSDPASGDRQLSSLLDWVAAQPELDEKRVVLLGTSTGGYNAVRAAHTYHDRLVKVVAQGCLSDLGFSREWLDLADGGEYPFAITEALSIKFGFESAEEMKEKGRKKFSLAENGILNGECTDLTLLNGWDDTIFPIEDSLITLRHGRMKREKFFEGVGHMGEPSASEEVMRILTEFVATEST